MKIVKKIDKEYFEEVLKGIKNYEMRLNDFKCKAGDVLVLLEKDPKTKILTGRKIEKVITTVREFKIDQLPYEKEEVDKKGLKIISFK